jgi:protein glucosyltransferase
MDYVYDYMLHLLTQYAGLLRYKPTVPEKAVELCAETVECPSAAHANNREFDFMMQSRERYVADYQPCTLPPPFTDDEVREMARRDQVVRANVHKMMTTMTP